MLSVTARRDRLDAAIAATAAAEPWAPIVARLGAIRGVATLTALGLPGRTTIPTPDVATHAVHVAVSGRGHKVTVTAPQGHSSATGGGTRRRR